jgi:hypothetical protein
LHRDGGAGSALVVHPATDLPYASFVLDGFAQLLGPRAIHYSTEGFPTSYGGGRVLAFYPADRPSARCFLVFTDQTTVNPSGFEWARLYGMVNVAPDVNPDDGIVPLGPTFGVRLHSTALAMRHVMYTWRWGVEGRATRPSPRARRSMAFARTRAVAKHQRRRTSIDAYIPRPADPDYVFFTAWPWAKHPEVNPPRVEFIEACRRAPGLTFEGGFAPRRRRDVPEVLPFSTTGRTPIGEYLDKVGRSAVAFNNPAVHGCLGWKLGEFLALGKAIISLPITRVLPAPLEHGVHLHVVDGSPESLDDALDRLRRDRSYRRTLEINARQWYEANLAPVRLAARLLRMLDGA